MAYCPIIHQVLIARRSHTRAQSKILLHKSRQIRSRDAESLKTLTRTSKVNGACIRVLDQASGVVQWLRYLVHVRLLRREPEHIPTEEEYDIAAATVRSAAIDRALQEDATSRETKLVCNAVYEVHVRQTLTTPICP